MRTFSSYGPVSKESNFYVPRKELLQKAYDNLVGKHPDEGGHYFTVWASRQCGKSWLLRELFWQLRKDERYHVAKLELEILKTTGDIMESARYIISELNETAHIHLPLPETMLEFEQCFTDKYLDRPLLLILDEFDALDEGVIGKLVSSFRNIYLKRKGAEETGEDKRYLLHGAALIGVRSVLGVDNKTGSPFNVQRSLHIPNLTEAEVNEMYHWYEKESGQKIDQEVIDRVFYVTQGQPGLVSWFGELLTEQFNEKKHQPITMTEWNRVYIHALRALPNNNIINLISKAKTEPYKQTVLELFRTENKIEFRFEKPDFSFLYMNGVITFEAGDDGKLFARFPCQFVQEKLFDYFSAEIFSTTGRLLPDPFIDLDPIINEERIDVPKLLELYGRYFQENKGWLLKDVPRRSDNRIFEAVYHFSLYSWLSTFLLPFQVKVIPEFPTGNGKIDLILRRGENLYGMELKSFLNMAQLKMAIAQAGHYGKTLGLERITLAVFVERELPEDKKPLYANPFEVPEGAVVDVVFLVTG